jgi:EAL domain-containing protein (putative c-di-GMP-specific phosphodiesterase class I)
MPIDGPVLVVDDDPVFITVTDNVLRALGVSEVLCANNGEAGIKTLCGSPDPVRLIVLDLNMPKLDGLGFMRAASSAGFSGDIIISSGESGKVIQAAQLMGRMLGINILGALKKPLNLDDLAVMMESCMRGRSAFGPRMRSDDETEISKEMLVPFYQPQYNACDKSLSGAEALARIDLGDERFMTPSGFFQKIGLSRGGTVIAKHVVRAVYADMCEWKSRGLSSNVSINLDASVLERPEFVPSFLDITEEISISPESVVLELTETALAKDTSRLLEALTRLVMAGFGLALDDYGTGGSNFELLKMCPFSELKIDLSIVQAITRDPLSMGFVEKTAEFARSLDLRLVAEGVETEEQFTAVRDLGVDVVQGFLFSKAMSSAGYADLLAQQNQLTIAV